MELELALARPRVAREFAEWVWKGLRRPWTLARAHNLNPWVFVTMAGVGHAIEALFFLPWFQNDAAQLALVILLRLAALVVPAYVLIKGRGIALAFNVSVAVMFAVNTAWSVCYYVYA